MAPVVVSPPQERHGAEPPGPEGVELPHAEERAAGHRLRQPLEPAQERWETYVQLQTASAWCLSPCGVGVPPCSVCLLQPPCPEGLSPTRNEAPLGAGCAGGQPPTAFGGPQPLCSPLPRADTRGWPWQPPDKGSRSGPGPGSSPGAGGGSRCPFKPSSLLPTRGRAAPRGRLGPCPAQLGGVPAPSCPGGGRARGPLPGGGSSCLGHCPRWGPAPGMLLITFFSSPGHAGAAPALPARGRAQSALS